MKHLIRSLTAVLVLGGSVAFFAGCSDSPTRRSTGETIDDTSISARVKTAFAQDPGVRAIDIKVEAYKGTVQLAGFADSEEQKKRAEEIAKGIAGVTTVENKIAVKTDLKR